jgi:hypothetical protein
MLATDSVSKYNTSLSLSLPHSETRLAYPMFSVSYVTARIQSCSTVNHGLRLLQREQISILYFINYVNSHSLLREVQSVLLPPISTHIILSHYGVLQPESLGR